MFHMNSTQFSVEFDTIFFKNFMPFLSEFKYFLHSFIVDYALVYVILFCFLSFSAGADRQPLILCVYPK